MTMLSDSKLCGYQLMKIAKLESVGVLAGGIAHDLNNMLTGILGNLSLARQSAQRAERDEFLSNAETALFRLKDLTKQLLTFSKGSSPVLASVDLGDLLHESVPFTLHGSSIVSEFDLPGNFWQVSIDIGQINQVVNNLIINAQQAMPRRDLPCLTLVS